MRYFFTKMKGKVSAAISGLTIYLSNSLIIFFVKKPIYLLLFGVKKTDL